MPGCLRPAQQGADWEGQSHSLSGPLIADTQSSALNKLLTARPGWRPPRRGRRWRRCTHSPGSGTGACQALAELEPRAQPCPVLRKDGRRASTFS